MPFLWKDFKCFFCFFYNRIKDTNLGCQILKIQIINKNINTLRCLKVKLIEVKIFEDKKIYALPNLYKCFSRGVSDQLKTCQQNAVVLKCSLPINNHAA